MHVLALQSALPGTSYVSMTSTLPMLRAVKDADEIEHIALAEALFLERYAQEAGR